MELLVRGEDTNAMALALGVGPATIRTHLQNLFRKLAVHSRAELVALSIREGFVDPHG